MAKVQVSRVRLKPAGYVVIAIIISLMLWGILTLIKPTPKVTNKVGDNAACRSDAVGDKLKKEYKNFDTSQLPSLKPLVEEIKTMEDSGSSVNCQYVLGKYAYLSADYSAAVSHFESLLTLSKDSEWIDPSISNESKASVTMLLDAAKQGNEPYKKSSTMVNPITNKQQERKN